MVATDPGEPNTSKSTRLGVVGGVLRESALGRDTTLWEPKIPCNRYTANPVTASTVMKTSTIHRPLISLPTDILCTRTPFDRRHDSSNEGTSFDAAVKTGLIRRPGR